MRRLSRLNGYSCIRIAEGGEWKTAIRMRYGLLEHLGCHLSSEGIAMSPAKTQSIKDWAEQRSVEKVVQRFSSCANLYREVAGTDSANRGLGCVGKCQEHSAVLGLRELLAFNWAEATRSALVTSKHLFTVAPIRETKGPIWWHITRGNSSQPT
jgi:hypothetical protein